MPARPISTSEARLQPIPEPEFGPSAHLATSSSCRRHHQRRPVRPFAGGTGGCSKHPDPGPRCRLLRDADRPQRRQHPPGRARTRPPRGPAGATAAASRPWRRSAMPRRINRLSPIWSHAAFAWTSSRRRRCDVQRQRARRDAGLFRPARLCALPPQPGADAVGGAGRAASAQGRSRRVLCRCRRRRRSQGRAVGDRGVPARTGPVWRHRRPHPQGRAACRPSGHGQDAARALDCGRSGRAVPVRERLGLRRDVRRRRRLSRAQALQGSPQARGLHRLHRRARRRRPEPRQPVAQSRRARADAEPAARRDGRLRPERGHRRHRRDQPPRHPRQGAHAPRPLRPAGHRRQPRPARPRGDSRHSLTQGADHAGRRPARGRARHAGLFRRRSRQPRERGGAACRARRASRHRGQRSSRRRATRC